MEIFGIVKAGSIVLTKPFNLRDILFKKSNWFFIKNIKVDDKIFFWFGKISILFNWWLFVTLMKKFTKHNISIV